MDLPLELIEMIFRLLPVGQLITLRLVNKRWLAIVDAVIKNLKVDKLILSDKWTFKENRFPSYEPIDCDDLIKINDYDNFKLKREQMFIRIKFLFIYSTKKIEKNKSTFKLVDLVNCFIELESLKIIGLNLDNQEGECINLKSLKSLDVENFECNTITMNTPNLENFRTFNSYYGRITFKYPLSMKRLFVDNIYSNFIEEFSNLEYFYIRHVYNLHRTILEELPVLKELHFESICNVDCYETVLESMKEYDRYDCKPFMYGVNFESLNEDERLNKSYSIDKDVIKFFQMHPTRIADKLRFIDSLFYNDLECMYDRIPFDLIDKLVSLKKFEIKGAIKNVDQLIEVLKCLSKRIMVLSISFAELGQAFFDRLPNVISTLDQLKITNEKINFDFLFKFRCIQGFETDQNFTTEMVNRFMTKYEKNFKYINYKERSNTIRITRTPDGLITDKLEITNYEDNHHNSYDIEMGLDNLFYC